jgi:hypothetical protein
MIGIISSMFDDILPYVENIYSSPFSLAESAILP